MGEFTQEERERATECLYIRAWWGEEAEFVPRPDTWKRRALEGNMPILTSQQTIELQAELNRANAAIAEARALLEVYEEARQSSAWLDRRHLWLSKHAEPAK